MAVSHSAIEWTDSTWSPIRGCSRVSKGCRNCYAERQAHRFSGPDQPYAGLTRMTSHGPAWAGEIMLVPWLLDQPLRWRKPRRIFVASMSDLFHERVPDDFLDHMFGVMRQCPQHVFQCLTKRHERQRDYLVRRNFLLPNVWVGVSVEDQESADERIPVLLETPAALRWISAEPLLGPIDLRFTNGLVHGCDAADYRLDWVVTGGESGPGARPCNVGWIRSVVDQCREANTPVFVKQLGVKPTGWCVEGRCRLLADRKGGDMTEWPIGLRVREYPRCP